MSMTIAPPRPAPRPTPGANTAPSRPPFREAVPIERSPYLWHLLTRL